MEAVLGTLADRVLDSYFPADGTIALDNTGRQHLISMIKDTGFNERVHHPGETRIDGLYSRVKGGSIEYLFSSDTVKPEQGFFYVQFDNQNDAERFEADYGGARLNDAMIMGAMGTGLGAVVGGFLALGHAAYTAPQSGYTEAFPFFKEIAICMVVAGLAGYVLGSILGRRSSRRTRQKFLDDYGVKMLEGRQAVLAALSQEKPKE